MPNSNSRFRGRPLMQQEGTPAQRARYRQWLRKKAKDKAKQAAQRLKGKPHHESNSELYLGTPG